MSNPFHFKQFTIYQKNAAMKVGTDSILLGAWADLKDASRILDVGTGTGLLAIMAAQRNSNAQIDAVEIDPLACKDAILNINACPWNNRITLHSASIFDFSPSHTYEHIISNPPFFYASLLSPNLHRSKARHCNGFTLFDFIHKVRMLLKEGGKFSFILPLDIGIELMKSSKTYHFYPARFCRVFPNPGKAAKRLLIELSTIPVSVQEGNIIVEYTRHEYSEEYIKLTEFFYLNL